MQLQLHLAVCPTSLLNSRCGIEEMCLAVLQLLHFLSGRGNRARFFFGGQAPIPVIAIVLPIRIAALGIKPSGCQTLTVMPKRKPGNLKQFGDFSRRSFLFDVGFRDHSAKSEMR